MIFIGLMVDRTKLAQTVFLYSKIRIFIEFKKII